MSTSPLRSWRILHVAANPDTGVAKSIATIARAQTNVGASVRIHLVRYSTRATPSWLEAFDCKWATTPPMPGVAVLGTLRAAAMVGAGLHDALVRESGRVIYHFHDVSLAGAVMSRRLKRNGPVIVTLHGASTMVHLKGRPLRRAVYGHWIRRGLRMADTVTSVDSVTPREYGRFFGCDLSRVRTIPNAIAACGRVTRPNPCDVVVAQVCTMDANKGWRLTASAVESCRRAGIPVRLLLVGPGPETDAARVWCEQRSDFATYVPWVDDVPRDVLPQVDAIVLASEREGMPMVILEALAAGIPVIATRAGGIPEMIQDGVEGFLVDRSVPAIGEAIRKIATNPALREQLGHAGRVRWEGAYRPEIIEEQYANVYCEALASRPRILDV
jgi:glycosyltransferase involved in cell wall biosynthesis